VNIENEVRNVIEEKLQEGLIEKLVAENLEKGINKSLENLLGSYGDVTKVIEKSLKEVMVDQLSKYDYSKYIVKLDYVLTEILKNTVLDNKKILENFKDFMTDVEIPKVLKISDIFKKYCDYVAKNIETSDLEVDTCDGEPSYELVDVTFEIEEQEKKSWSSYSEATMVFECEKDENLNYELKLSRWNSDKFWKISIGEKCDLVSLRHLDEFKIYLMKISQNYTDIEIDDWNDNAEVQPESEPECSWN